MRTVFATLLFTGALALALPAGAAKEDRWLQANGSGVCQAALPNYEGQIRKRPLAIQNEGTATAFVTCSPTSLWHVEASPRGHAVVLRNSGAPATFSCTGVMGGLNTNTQEYSPKSGIVNYAVNIYWKPADFPVNGDRSRTTFNVSCALAPGVGVETVFIAQVIDIGD